MEYDNKEAIYTQKTKGVIQTLYPSKTIFGLIHDCRAFLISETSYKTKKCWFLEHRIGNTPVVSDIGHYSLQKNGNICHIL